MDIIINDTIDCLPPSAREMVTAGDGFLNFLQCLGYAPSSPPLGDLLRRYHQLEGEWLVVSPIYWEATHNDAMIMADAGALAITPEDSCSLYDDMVSFFVEMGLTLHYHDAKTWLVNVDGQPDLHSQPPYLLLHQSMMPALNVMGTSFYWQRLLTEIQMYLSNHVLAKKIGVNGLWFYGRGAFAFNGQIPILTDDESVRYLAPDTIQTLSFEKPLNKSSILYINDPEKIETMPDLNRFATRWFWNNIAYSIPPENWWKRLYRYLPN